MVVAAVFVGCYDYDEYDIATGEPVTVELAYTFSSAAAGNRTRQADEVVQPDNLVSPRYPAPDDLRIIPLDKNSVPQASDVTWGEPVVKPDPRSRFYYSTYCELATGVKRCLVYGSVNNQTPPGSISEKVYNGSIIPYFPASIASASDVLDITFSLEPIYTRDENTNASVLADYLTAVANVDGWKTSEDVTLSNLFANFTNHGYSLPGSAASVRQWLTDLKAAADYYRSSSNPAAVGDAEKNILLEISNTAGTKAGLINVTDNSYPRNLNLPDGAAALRWTGTAFEPQWETTTLDDINSVKRFAYPAALYYYVNSPVKTSASPVTLSAVYSEVESDIDGTTSEVTKTAWSKVLDHFDDDEVTQDTKSVALRDPVQYAVAQLQVNILANPILQDATIPTPQDISIGENDETFLLKGVIICGQRPVTYMFEQADKTDGNVKFIYDSQVKPNCYLTTTQTAACNTLVFQSYGDELGGENVNVILEFENTSSTLSFKCVDGMVHPGTRFYLIGKVEAPVYVENDEKTHRVFTKDYITTVNMTVTSLAKAYNLLPNLLSSNLEIGVKTTPDWIAATPEVVRME